MHSCLKIHFFPPFYFLFRFAAHISCSRITTSWTAKKTLQPKKYARNAYAPKMNPSHEHALAFSSSAENCPTTRIPITRECEGGGGETISENKRRVSYSFYCLEKESDFFPAPCPISHDCALGADPLEQDPPEAVT